MKEILFRGIRIDNGEMVEGFFTEIIDTQYNKHTFNIVTPTGECHAIFEYPVLQYTGLTDKNGMRIFEGDELQFGNRKFVVTFVGKPHAYFGVVDKNDEYAQICPFGHFAYAAEMEVIRKYIP